MERQCGRDAHDPEKARRHHLRDRNALPRNVLQLLECRMPVCRAVDQDHGRNKSATHYVECLHSLDRERLPAKLLGRGALS
jgi:hypothetical protein